MKGNLLYISSELERNRTITFGLKCVSLQLNHVDDNLKPNEISSSERNERVREERKREKMPCASNSSSQTFVMFICLMRLNTTDIYCNKFIEQFSA